MTQPSDAAAPNSHQLLPTIFETRAKLNPDGVFAKFPVSSTNYDSGFRSVTHLQALNAINHVAWVIEKSFGKGQNFETIAYLGPNDPRSHIVLIAGIKVGYKVSLLPCLPQQHPDADF
jgi:acyl-CoA synthetase (AMP-forming)/AMP-acid ligase II